MFGTGFVLTEGLTVCLRLHGVERRVPATYISDGEVRFLTPSFADAGDARVTLSLNGQDYEPGTEVVFRYAASSMLGACTLQ